MNLNKLKDRAYQIACEHGWHEQELSDEHCLMLVITELSEAVNAYRKGKHADISKFKEWQGNSLPLSEETRARRFKEDFEQYIKESVEDELSDVIIRCLDFAGMRGWDLQEISDKVFDVSETGRLIGDLTFAEIAYGICGCIFEGDDSQEAVEGILKVVIAYYIWRGIDIEWYIEQKMKYNELREYKHGNKKY